MVKQFATILLVAPICFFILSIGCRGKQDAATNEPATEKETVTPTLLIDEMKKNGLNFDRFGLKKFIKKKLGDIETGKLEGQFAINGIAVYRVPRTTVDGIWLKGVLPFRLIKAPTRDRQNAFGLTGASSLAACRANFLDTHFLTKDQRLAKCTPQEALKMLGRDGILFYGESTSSSELYFGGVDSIEFAEQLQNLPVNEFDRKKKHVFFIDLVVENLQNEPSWVTMDAWGFYQREALLSNSYDSDYIESSNFAGDLTSVPTYFRPTKPIEPNIVTADLVEARLRAKDGTIIATYVRKTAMEELRSFNK